MALTILRTAYSGVLKDNMDYSTAFCDGGGPAGRARADAAGPSRLDPDGAGRDAARASASDIRPGDVFMPERPVRGRHAPAGHLRLQADLPGRRTARPSRPRSATTPTSAAGSPGSNASDSTEIYQEGLRIPPLKLYDARQAQRDLSRCIERNVRVPVRVFGDLRAQLAACHIAERGRPGAGRPPRRRRASPRLHARAARLRRAPDPGRDRASCPTANVPSRTGSTTTASTSASRSALLCHASTKAGDRHASSTGPAPRRRSRAPSTTPSPSPRPRAHGA